MRMDALLEGFRKDQEQILSLARQLVAEKGKGKGREKIWDQLRRELTRQVFVEEEYILPQLRRHTVSRWLARPVLSYHSTADRCITFLERLPLGEARWEAVAAELLQTIQWRSDSGQLAEIYLTLKQVVDREELKALVNRIRKELAA